MKVASLDWETSMKPTMHPWQTDAFPVACGLYFEDGTYFDWWFQHDEVTDSDNPADITEKLRDVDLLCGHNLKFDLNWLKHLGVKYDGKMWCTNVSEYLLSGQQRGELKLETVAVNRGASEKLDIVQGYWDRGTNTNKIPKHILQRYLKQDCKSTIEVYQDQHREMTIERPHLRQIMTIHNNTIDILSDIELNGMPVDIQRMNQIARDHKAKLTGMDQSLRDLLKVPDLNLQSKDELSASLYGGIIKREGTEMVEKERWATRKKPFKFTYADGRTTMKTKNERYREKYQVERKCVKEIKLRGVGFETKKDMELKPKSDGRVYFKTGIEVIKNLKAGTAVRRSIKNDLIERGKVSKLVSTLLGSAPGKGYVNKLQADGHMHPQYNQTRTGTGRYSSKDPNGQNFSRSKEDQDGFLNPLKTIFVPSISISEGGCIASGDLGQLEWRVAAFLSQDPVAMDEIWQGIDAHADNAVRFFGDIKFRQDAKIMTFRLLYGGTAYSFFMDPLMPAFTLAKWTQIVQQYYTKYHILAAWQAANINLVEQNGGWYISKFGRIYRFPISQMSKNVGGQRIYYDGYKPTQIKNYEVQGTATGDIVPFSMYILQQRMANSFPATKWIGQIHDAVLFDTSVLEIRRLADLIIQTFEDLPGLIEKFWGFKFNLPLTGDVEVGPNYGTMPIKFKREEIGSPTILKGEMWDGYKKAA